MTEKTENRKRLAACIEYTDAGWWFYTFNVDICDNDSGVKLLNDWEKISRIRRTLKSIFTEEPRLRDHGGGIVLEYYFDFNEWLEYIENKE